MKGADGCQRHDDAGFHVEDTGAPVAAAFFAPGHVCQGADRPDCVEMAEEENGLAGGAGGAEAEFEDVAEVFLAVAFDAAAECAGEVFDDCGGGVNRCWIFTWGFLLD